MEVDIALLRNVRREFRVLEKKAKNSPTPDDIHDIAGALSHLLIDGGQGLLKRGWDELKPVVSGVPKEPVISVINLGGILDLKLPHGLNGKTIALANDVTMGNGVRIMASISAPTLISDEDLKEQAELLERGWHTLSRYKESVCMILGPAYISRATILKYVANNLGARHYDTKRRTQQPMTVQDQIHLILDRSFDFYGDNPQPHNLQVYYGESGNALHAAILSMCQGLEESPDIQWFISTLDRSIQSPPNLGFK